MKDVIVEHSADGNDWTPLEGVSEFARATGMNDYAHNTTVAFNGAPAKYVKVTANSTWGGALFSQYGLSEVRFFSIPVDAKEPSPDIGAIDVALDVTLGWKAGREATKHNVYLSDDMQAVLDDTAFIDTVAETIYGPLSLNLGTTYYWRVDEVNEAETPTTWKGDVWDFKTQEYLVVENFEDYSDYQPNMVFDTWKDGYGDPANGSTAGYPDPDFFNGEHYMETMIVHDGEQSMPLCYDNSIASYSEVTANTNDLVIGRDWTKGSPGMLVLWFYGKNSNAVTEQMYVKINDAKVVYDGDAGNIAIRRWIQWNIDLASLGVNLSDVTPLSIGFEKTGTSRGTGIVFIDDICLYKTPPQELEPIDPGTDGLKASYPFDKNANDVSGNGYNGTFLGSAHVQDGVLALDGNNDAVAIPAIGQGLTDLTFAMYVYPTVDLTPLQFSGGLNTDVWDGGIHFKLNYGRVNVGISGLSLGDVVGTTIVEPDMWTHIAVTMSPTEVAVYVNGQIESSRTGITVPSVNLGNAAIGAWHSDGVDVLREMAGMMDDVLIYDRALSAAEVIYLASQ